MTAWVLVLAGVAAGDGGMRMGAATAPVAVDLGGRWVGTYEDDGGFPKVAELSRGVLRLWPPDLTFRCRVTARGEGACRGLSCWNPKCPSSSGGRDLQAGARATGHLL